MALNPETQSVLIALGSNVQSAHGNPAQTLIAAVAALGNYPLEGIETSSIYNTPAFPEGSGPDFANMALRARTNLTVPEVLGVLHEIEHTMGRQRRQRWAARVLDLDLLALGDQIFPDAPTWRYWCDLDPLAQRTTAPTQPVVPHPRLHERAFVLVPLADIAPDWCHPVLAQTVSQMLSNLEANDLSSIQKTHGPLAVDFQATHS